MRKREVKKRVAKALDPLVYRASKDWAKVVPKGRWRQKVRLREKALQGVLAEWTRRTRMTNATV